MNYRKTIFALLAAGLFAYSLWNAVDFIKERKSKKQWTNEQRTIMVLGCIKSSKVLSRIDSITSKTICSCAIEKLINKYTYNEIWELDDASKQDKTVASKLFEPLMEECMTPYLKDIKTQMDIADCTDTVSKSNKMTKEQAYKYCSCFLTYINNKYSAEQLVSIDSIINLELDKAKECIGNATR